MASIHNYDNDKGTDYEPVDLGEGADTRRLSTSSDDCVNTTLRLPAKALPPRRSLWPFAISATVAFIMIISMSVLLHYLPMLQPDVTSYSFIGDDKSCDLTKPSDSRLENAFVINLRSSLHLSFAEAKLIDVLWDLFMGQGGRLLMAWVAYRVFMDGLVSLMETTPVSHDLYAALVFETTSLWTTWKATKALVRSRHWRSRAFVLWFCLATIYTLSFTTLMSAATGYVTPSKAGYTLVCLSGALITILFSHSPNGDFVMPNSEKLRNCLVLDAGALIGETNGTVINGPQALEKLDEPTMSFYPDYQFLVKYDRTNNRQYNETIDNLRASTFSSYSKLNYTTNITWHNHTYTFHNFDFSHTYSDQVYNNHCYDDKVLPTYSDSNKLCMPDPYFVWGFSSKLLKVILYFQIAWTFAMLFIWLHANMTSQLLFKNRQVRGAFRASADLAEAMQDVLGDEFCAYSDGEIAKELARDEKGLRYYTSENSDKGILHIGVGSRGGVGLDDSKLYGGERRRRNAGGIRLTHFQ